MRGRWPASTTILLLLLAFPVSAKKPKPEPQRYITTRTYAEPCEAIWPRVIPVLASHGLAPENSDRAAGFMRLRYTLGDIAGLGAVNKEVRKVTLASTDFWHTWERMHIGGGTLTLASNPDGCTGVVQIEYSGYINSFQKGWYVLQSNGLFEATVLNELERK